MKVGYLVQQLSIRKLSGMNAVKSRSYITILLHVLLWMLFAFVLLFYQPLTWGINVPYQFWMKQSVVLILLIVVFYLNSMVLVPQLVLRNKSLLFLLIILLIAVAAGPLVHLFEDAVQLPRLMEKAFDQVGMHRPPKKSDRLDLFLILMLLIIVGISTSVTIIQKWQADKQLREALEKEKIGSELSFLKAQINPHFFFNTLNNIYALTHVDVENSRNALHKLSRMMRYLLYDTQSGVTSLKKEVSFIQDYITLMKLRLNETTKVIFNAPDDGDAVEIAPMMILPYVENAFKHGVSTVVPSEIFIDLVLNGRQLELTVTNSIFSDQSVSADEYGGIGLHNTKRRLDLLYPNTHTFSAGQTEDHKFIVHLTLTLDGTELHRS